ncbi:MAG: alanine racemase [Actinomycetota bacterium]|nr:alanine racemase [Actinomycetota bacterium]MDG2119665.1 alanine racemase [Actinomycetota bacterium]
MTAFGEMMRPTWCEINLGALEKNFNVIRKRANNSMVMPVIKADAYGHGIEKIGLHLEQLGADRLAVAYVEEGVVLRQAGVTIPIHVMGGAIKRQIPLFLDHDLIFTAPSIEKLEQINDAAKTRGLKAVVHLKIDTGMERIGVHHYKAESFLLASLKCESIIVEGVFSHFARADETNLSSALLQLERFNQVLEFYDKKNLPTPLRHISNSGGIAQIPDANLDIVRPGILMFGVYPSPETQRTVAVEPVLSWHSEVIYFKVVEAGNPVSYGGTWQPDKQTRVVTLPVGYADGYRRDLSNCAEVLVRGQRYPVVGRVCMDQTMLDIGTGTAYNGDVVTLIGSDGDHSISAEDLAEWSGTIPYEVLASISARVPRVYVDSAK